MKQAILNKTCCNFMFQSLIVRSSDAVQMMKPSTTAMPVMPALCTWTPRTSYSTNRFTCWTNIYCNCWFLFTSATLCIHQFLLLCSTASCSKTAYTENVKWQMLKTVKRVLQIFLYYLHTDGNDWWVTVYHLTSGCMITELAKRWMQLTATKHLPEC